MAIPVIMPRQGQSVESCIITQWHKAPGDKVNVGDMLFSYETDKASFEEESTVEGTFLGTFYEEFDDVPVLVNVCVIGEEGESIAEFNQRDDAKGEVNSNENTEAIAQETKAETTEEDTGGSIPQTITASGSDKVSPRAKNLANKLGIDVKQAEATGPKGRVIEADILKLKEQGIFATSAALASGDSLPASGSGIGGRASVADIGSVASASTMEVTAPNSLGYRDEKLPNIRKVIAKAMQNSLQTTSQLTLSSSFDASEIMALRKKLKALDVEFNVTLNDMIMFAVSRVLKKFPALNAHFLGDTMRYFDDVNLGLAVDTERGLLVPTIFGADTKSLVEISNEVKAVAAMSKEGTISPDLLQGGSFTITNLGVFGIESFTPVLNAPQTGILGVNTITQKVRVVDGEVTTYPSMGLSLTFDHGALDGAPAARFLKELGEALENFTILLMK